MATAWEADTPTSAPTFMWPLPHSASSFWNIPTKQRHTLSKSDITDFLWVWVCGRYSLPDCRWLPPGACHAQSHLSERRSPPSWCQRRTANLDQRTSRTNKQLELTATDASYESTERCQWFWHVLSMTFINTKECPTVFCGLQQKQIHREHSPDPESNLEPEL